MVLFIGNFLSKHNGSIGPSEKVASLLAKNGIRVRTASSYKNRLLRLAVMLWKSLFLSYRILHVDVFSKNSMLFAISTAIIGKFRGKKVILTLHGGKLPEEFAHSPALFRRLFSKATRVVTPSRMLQKFFTAQGFAVECLPNFICHEAFPFSPHNNPSHTLLWVRAFSEIYNPWLAVETLSILKKQYPDIRLTMIGPDLGELQKTQELVRLNELEDAVDFPGLCPNDKLAPFYHTHCVLLNTTRYESFGISLLEAASCGLPVVSTSVGEIPQLWEHDKDMLLVEKPDPEAMAQQVKRLLDDPALRHSLANNARQKAEAYDWNVIKHQWYSLLELPN